MAADFETLKYEIPHDGVAMVVLNRPGSLNAFDPVLRRELGDAMRRISADDTVRAAVITGEGRAFCAGADVSAISEQYNVEDILNTEYAVFFERHPDDAQTGHCGDKWARRRHRHDDGVDLRSSGDG